MTMNENNFLQTASQTVGPYFHQGLIFGGENNLLQNQTTGTQIWLRGTVRDGDDQAVPDAMLEIWQADTQGFYNHQADPNQSKADPHFMGFGRAATDIHGAYWFRTIKPGIVAGQVAPYINLRLFSRGVLIHMVTRLYFSDETSNNQDAVLNSLPKTRRTTLIATRNDAPDGLTYRFDVQMQGPNETVFFDV